jgi:hypothetical protein
VAEVYGDFDVEMLVFNADSPPPATPATPATQDTSSSQNNDLETDSCRNDLATHCDSVATQPDPALAESQCVAAESQNADHEQVVENAEDMDLSRRSRRSRSYPDAAICTIPPCFLCGGNERWDDHGILRCVACYPPGSMTLQRTMETLLACRRCGSMAAPVGDAPCPDGSILMRCPDCRLPRMAIPPEHRRDDL